MDYGVQRLNNNKFLRVFAVLIGISLMATLVISGSMAQEATTLGRTLIDRYADTPFARTEDGAFVLGDPDASVTMVEFADFMCPHCQDYEEVATQFINDYVMTGQARYEYRFFPLVHPVYSELTARTAECANTLQDGMFWPAHDLIFELARSSQVGDDLPNIVAQNLGLSGNEMLNCIVTAEQYKVDQELGTDVGVNGTPAVLVRRGASDLEWLVVDGQTFDQGGVPYSVLQGFVMGSENVTTTPPDSLLNDTMLADTSLVSGEPCAAPCWRGITPGETSWEDALVILEGSADLANIQTQAAPNSSAAQAIWGAIDGDACCQMVTNDGLVVNALLLQTAPVMTLGEVIEAHGEPTYLSASVFTSKQAVMNLFYPEIPMVLYVFVSGPETGTLSETSEVIGLLYITPESMESVFASSDLYAWQGYASFATYAESEFADTTTK